MNNAVKETLIFVGGAAIGAFLSYISIKSYYERKADEEVDSVKMAFEDKLAEIEDEKAKSSLDGELLGPSEINEGNHEKSDLVKKLNNKPPLTDYTKFFKEKNEQTLDLKETIRDAKEDALAESEAPPEDEPYTDEEDRDESLDYEDYKLNGEHKKALLENRDPYLIDLSDYELTCKNYEKLSLLYYIHNDILCEESGEEVNRFDLLGNSIAAYGFEDNEEEHLYIRNDKLMCDYDVIKVYIPYEN